jgi:hypothetical protein
VPATNTPRCALRACHPTASEAFEDCDDRDALAVLGSVATPAKLRI